MEPWRAIKTGVDVRVFCRAAERDKAIEGQWVWFRVTWAPSPLRASDEFQATALEEPTTPVEGRPGERVEKARPCVLLAYMVDEVRR